MTQRVGLWLVGAFGGVGTAITVGLSAMKRGLADRTGLVSELPVFGGLPLPELADFVIGGHDIRATSFSESAEEFRVESGVFEGAGSLRAATIWKPPAHGFAPDRTSGPAGPSPSSRTGVPQDRSNRPGQPSTASPGTWPRSRRPKHSIT